MKNVMNVEKQKKLRKIFIIVQIVLNLYVIHVKVII